jgi:hypothetical protein
MRKKDIVIALWILAGISLLVFGPVLLVKLSPAPAPAPATATQKFQPYKETSRTQEPEAAEEGMSRDQFCVTARANLKRIYPESTLLCPNHDISITIYARDESDVVNAKIEAGRIAKSGWRLFDILHKTVCNRSTGHCESYDERVERQVVRRDLIPSTNK